jgi:TRAP-type C4-dicarboxylate transport system permease small subunit
MKILTAADDLLERVYRWCGYLAAALIVFMVVLVLINIISRLLHAFIPGLTEIAGYCMAGSGALALAYTFGDNGHIRVKMLLDRLRGNTRLAAEVWALAVSAGLITFTAVFMLKMLYYAGYLEARSDDSDAMLLWIAQTPMVIGFVVFAICLIHVLVKVVVLGDVDRAMRGK